MAKHQTGTIQEILARHYAKARETNSPTYGDGRKSDKTRKAISRRMKAWWAQPNNSHIRRRVNRLSQQDMELIKVLAEKHHAQELNPTWRAENSRGPIHLTSNDRQHLAERRKAKIAQWRSESLPK